MSYEIKCRECKRSTDAGSIVNLLGKYTSKNGRFICGQCGKTDTFIYRESQLQETGKVWARWIKGVLTIDTGIPTYCPYIFLTADAEDGDASGLHFHYYKDTRHQPGGKLKHGHGPGGPPVLKHKDLFTIIKHLVESGLLTKAEVSQFAKGL